MWQLTRVDNLAGSELRFSDGRDMFATRGETPGSVRLMITNQGFIDFTTVESPHIPSAETFRHSEHHSCVDLNHKSIPISSESSTTTGIYLSLPGDGSFRFSTNRFNFTSGKLKPLPKVSKLDIEYFQDMVNHGLVPYSPSRSKGKTKEEISELGLRYFPFSPHSYQLAMAIYDWTTASFARMVILKMFEYTSIPENPPPVDKLGIASAIFDSDWSPFTPDNPDYMRSFLMTPAQSKQEVSAQLEVVLPQLQLYSAAENRVLAAAAASMPRTPKFSALRLYSGQPDMRQFGLDQFGVQFAQCPPNAGPPGVPLRFDMNEALDTFLRPGKVITTKQVWSFSDSMDIAMSYQNGIILIVEPPDDGSLVWETPCYVTPLSCESDKIEWIFPLGTSFIVLSTEHREVSGGSVLILTLRETATRSRAKGIEASCKVVLPNFSLNPTPSKLGVLPQEHRKVLPAIRGFWIWCAFILSIMFTRKSISLK